MSTIIDRRPNQGQKNLGNRQRFIRKSTTQIKKSLRENLQNRSITDVTSGEKVRVPIDTIREPTFGHDWQSGIKKRVLPGNKDYVPQDQIKRPDGGTTGGSGNQASNSDDITEDEFTFTLTKEEFYDLLFEDLELPDLVKKQLKKSHTWEIKREGISTVGNPSALNVIRTMKSSLGRRLVLRRPNERLIEQLEQELLDPQTSSSRKLEIEQEIAKLRKRVKAVAYVDPIDLRYNVFNKKNVPTTTAVMICIMDVSGSMDERKKDIAKRFFMLLYLFLQKKYENVQIEFIRHHTSAERVDEQKFFYDRVSGGTIVSTGLECAEQIIHADYDPNLYNVYVCQVSDGDNYDLDNNKCMKILQDRLLPLIQYMAYIEVIDHGWEEYGLLHYMNTRLFNTYQTVANNDNKLQIAKVQSANDIYKVFRNLFEKR